MHCKDTILRTQNNWPYSKLIPNSGIIYGIDKYKAKKAKWRIPETTLLMMAVVGGSIGAWLGMKVWHHKTMHKKFKYGIPAILFLQIAAMIYLHMNL